MSVYAGLKASNVTTTNSLSVNNGTNSITINPTNISGTNLTISNPILTGNHYGVTADVSENTSKLATTAYVKSQGYALLNVSQSFTAPQRFSSIVTPIIKGSNDTASTTPSISNITQNNDMLSFSKGCSLIVGNNSNTGANYRLYIAGSDANHFIYSSGSGDVTFFGEYARWYFQCTRTGGNVATINDVGAYSQLSDINAKKDFEPSMLGLNEILQLKPTLFRYKTQEGGEKTLGFIAQEVQPIIPSAFVNENGFIGLNYNGFIPVLTKAIQDMKQDYETKLSKLEERIHSLEVNNP